MKAIINNMEFDLAHQVPTDYLNNFNFDIQTGVYSSDTIRLKLDEDKHIKTLHTTNVDVSFVVTDENEYNVKQALVRLGYRITRGRSNKTVHIESIKDTFQAWINEVPISLIADTSAAVDSQVCVGTVEDLGSGCFMSRTPNLTKVSTITGNTTDVLAWGNFKALGFRIGQIEDVEKLTKHESFRALESTMAHYEVLGYEVCVHFQQINPNKVHIHGLEILY